jgi:hypothetical protein
MTNGTKTLLGLALLILLVFVGVAAYNNNRETVPQSQNTTGNATTTIDNATTTDTGFGNGAAGGAAGGTELDAEGRCEEKGGTWSAAFKECTGVDETSCKAIGGTWNDCASPCRNDPNAEVCIMMCVQVCTIK